MANNYLLFSEKLPLKSHEEKEWAEKVLEKMESLAEENLGIPENQAENFAQRQGFHEGFGWNLCYEVTDEHVWFYTEEGGDISYIGEFVRQFFEEWRPEGVFTLSYSETCDQPRIGEFGGGGMVVNAKEIRYHNVYDWVTETARDMEYKEI